jgi:hypothetical protein
MADAGAVRLQRDGAVAAIVFDRPHPPKPMTWSM